MNSKSDFFSAEATFIIMEQLFLSYIASNKCYWQLLLYVGQVLFKSGGPTSPTLLGKWGLKCKKTLPKRNITTGWRAGNTRVRAGSRVAARAAGQCAAPADTVCQPQLGRFIVGQLPCRKPSRVRPLVSQRNSALMYNKGQDCTKYVKLPLFSKRSAGPLL